MADEPSKLSPEKEQAEILKLLAEAKKAEAEAAKVAAEADKIRHEANTAAQYARQVKAEADQATWAREEKEREHSRKLAQDKYHYVYRFNDVFTPQSVKAAIDELSIFHRTSPSCTIEVVFDSPGGSIIDGMDLFDYIQELRRGGHHIVTAARGMAASMAGILLQAGDERVMGRECYMLIHQIVTAVRGKVGDIEDEVKFIQMISERILNIFTERAKEAGVNGTAEKPITKAQLRRGWERKDWWLDSETCLKYGLIDRIR